MGETILDLKSVGLVVAGRTLLREVTFSIPRGQCIGLVGETGSGKSLTTRVVTGLTSRIPRAELSGSAVYDGRELVGLSESEWKTLRGSEIALVPQASLNALDPVMRIGRQIDEVLKTLRRRGIETPTSVELLEEVRMPRPKEVLRLYPHELSGGMRQRVMIALALAGRPSLLVADEPTTALDVTVQKGILDLLRDMRQRLQMSILLVTHDLGVIQDIAQQVVILYSGMVLETGPAAAVIDAPRHPYTKALLAAQPGSSPYGQPLRSISGFPPPPHEEMPGCRFADRCGYVRAGCREKAPLVRLAADGRGTACWCWDDLDLRAEER
jgi:oligopeptide/dipeptide ABC transporter ATP-binding protein